jgi:23S rRNA (cytidine2498-2'-O)-methyltransferase
LLNGIDWTAGPPLDRILLYCRGGFEKECAAEITEAMDALGAPGHVKTHPDSGFAVFVGSDDTCFRAAAERLRYSDLVFARQIVYALPPISDLPVNGRAAPLVERAAGLCRAYSDVFLETADTGAAKQLAVFLRKFAAPFRLALEAAVPIGQPGAPRLHLFFLNSTAAYLGVSIPGNSSPHLMGIPRLKFPRGAPSRSTLKLEEAFFAFVRDPARELAPGMTAVDLGAAPGGWTWQLARRHIRTVAVDNGDLDSALLDSGLVRHLRVDGFRFRPSKPVDWLVCDMVEQPARIAGLVADWVAGGWARRAIFNLKLPMKKRREELRRCRRIVDERGRAEGIGMHLALKQLYHDRAEVTGHLTCGTRPPAV